MHELIYYINTNENVRGALAWKQDIFTHEYIIAMIT